MTDTPFGPDYIWNNLEEMTEAQRRMSMTPLQMAREFRTVFGQEVDQALTEDDFLNMREDDELAMELVREEAQEVEAAYYEEYEEGGSEALLKELADLVYVVYGYAAFRGWNLDKALTRIHLSNMTKVDPVTGTIIKREDGKVLKPSTYRPPYLKDLV